MRQEKRVYLRVSRQCSFSSTRDVSTHSRDKVRLRLRPARLDAPCTDKTRFSIWFYSRNRGKRVLSYREASVQSIYATTFQQESKLMRRAVCAARSVVHTTNEKWKCRLFTFTRRSDSRWYLPRRVQRVSYCWEHERPGKVSATRMFESVAGVPESAITRAEARIDDYCFMVRLLMENRVS